MHSGGGSAVSVHVLQAGPFSSLQDLGRPDSRKYGIPCGGVMDDLAARTLNLLVGNEMQVPVLEMAYGGVQLLTAQPLLVAFGGAVKTVRIDGMPVEAWQAVAVRQGATLQVEPYTDGMWGYMAVAGGFVGEHWFGSAATSFQVRRGGFHGRLLQAGDTLATAGTVQRAVSSGDESFRRIGKPLAYEMRSFASPIENGQPTVIRVVPGEHFRELDERSQTALFQQRFTVSAQSNRMGSRLHGEQLMFAEEPGADRWSQPVATGTVQLPPAGEPIVLLADSQTVGGYPVILHVIHVDLSRMAQVRPGKAIVFAPVSLDLAHALIARRTRHLRQLQAAIRMEVDNG
jgi:biotin-dependent carboxylase-like uncharacterized protein